MTGAESYEGMAPPPWPGVALADRLWRLGGDARDLWLAEEGSTEGEALGRRIEDLADEVRAMGDQVARALALVRATRRAGVPGYAVSNNLAALEMVLADPAVTVPGLGPDDSFAEWPAPARQPKAFEVGDRVWVYGRHPYAGQSGVLEARAVPERFDWVLRLTSGDRSLIFVCDHELWRGPG